MIRANVFSGKKTPPSSFLNTLVVKGGVEAIDPALKRLVATRWALLCSFDKNSWLQTSSVEWFLIPGFSNAFMQTILQTLVSLLHLSYHN